MPYLTGGVRGRHRRRRTAVPAYVEQTILLRQTELSGAGRRRLSLQSRAARGVPGRDDARSRSIEIIETEAYDLCERPACSSVTHRNSRVADTLHSGHSLGGAGLRHVDLRRDQPGWRPAVPARGGADVRGAASITPACSPTIAATSCRSRSTPLRAASCTTAGTAPAARTRACIPLYIGYPSLVRGYDVNTLDSGECVPAVAQRLPGVRPTDGQPHAGREPGVPLPAAAAVRGIAADVWTLPVEVALFADGGFAWNQATTPSLFGGSAEGVASVGAAFRVNLMGFAVGEFDFSHPLQRQQELGLPVPPVAGVLEWQTGESGKLGLGHGGQLQSISRILPAPA